MCVIESGLRGIGGRFCFHPLVRYYFSAALELVVVHQPLQSIGARQAKGVQSWMSGRSPLTKQLPGFPAYLLPGLPAYLLTGLPAYLLTGLPASRLTGFPASRLPGFPASRLTCPKNETSSYESFVAVLLMALDVPNTSR